MSYSALSPQPATVPGTEVTPGQDTLKGGGEGHLFVCFLLFGCTVQHMGS